MTAALHTHSHAWQDWASPALAAWLKAWADAGRGDAPLAVLPIAALEQHGPHLPLGVDALIAERLCAAVQAGLGAEEPILFLPLQSVGLSPEHASYSGSLSLRPETALALWQDMAAGVAAAGVRKLLIFNTHGGNVGLMDVAARQIRQQQGMAVWHSSWFNLPFDAATLALASADEHRFGAHAGQIETALMLHLAPHLVQMPQAQNFASSSQARAAQWPILGNGKSAKLGWLAQDYNPQGATGQAHLATAEQGQQWFEASVVLLGEMLREMSAIPLGQVLGQPV